MMRYSQVKAAILSILVLTGVTGFGVSKMPLELGSNITSQSVQSVITEGVMDNPVCLAKQNSNVKQSKNKNTGYWYEYTELELEAPGRYKLNPIIQDSEGNILRSVKSYADVSFTTTTKDCKDGYMKTIIEAKNNYKYSSLGDDEFVMLKWALIDMYSGRFFEDFAPDEDYVLKTYVGTKSKSDIHKFTVKDGKDEYEISWYNEAEGEDDGRTETFYITYPEEYNGVGIFISGAYGSAEDMSSISERAEELGGWYEMRAEDYFNFVTTPHIIDCRNDS
ncbi:hypothetical protein BXO88_05320 [Oribacterium sp. C9]|uniref:hypothetical protein n=1 Tax=Oribacterium sp. C9 TaxID=1943579 RepID=UPI00098EB0C9|nr:hypothetical protein [Oribacterium sp. C9]OON86964.1 hypothetical protein BXO88_05320 [Oribacterium sp. C9]